MLVFGDQIPVREEGPGQLLSQLEAMLGNILNNRMFPFLKHLFHHQDHASYDSNSPHLRCQCPLPHAHLASDNSVRVDKDLLFC